MASEKHPDQIPKIIKLNVGGRKFTTTRTTLTSQQNSMLAAMFSGRHALDIDEEGYYFIDRNGDLFAYLLDFLRSGSLSATIGEEALNDLMREAKYFQIELPMTSHPETEPHELRTDGIYYCAALHRAYCFAANHGYVYISRDLRCSTYKVTALGVIMLDEAKGFLFNDSLLIDAGVYQFYPHGYPAESVKYIDTEGSFTFTKGGCIEDVYREQTEIWLNCKRVTSTNGVPVVAATSKRDSMTVFCFGPVCVAELRTNRYCRIVTALNETKSQ